MEVESESRATSASSEDDYYHSSDSEEDNSPSRSKLRRKGGSDSQTYVSRKKRPSHRGGLGYKHTIKVWTLTLLVVVIPSVLWVSWIYNRLPPVLPAAQVPPAKFSEDRARRHLSVIVDEIGTRQGGSEACEKTKQYILQQLQMIKEAPCPSLVGQCAKVEIDVQVSGTGGYYVDFMDHIINNAYSKVTNIVVRITDGSEECNKNAVLVNGHYDTGLASPGAGDNAAAVSAMIEMVRAMASQSPPKSAAIFLFNGAEESLLQASHAFVTTHPWAKTIRAAINLEGAGSGGPEIMFQSTSGALAYAYTAAAPYPHGSVLGEELFASGAIPSDTDFRIFRDVGHWPGIDIAYYRNGYVYHTPIDDMRFVNLGSIQHLGENVLSVVRYLTFNVDGSFDSVRNSSLTRPVYFDLFGFTMVLYSRDAMVAFNWATVCLATVTFWQTRPRFNAPLQILPLVSVFGSLLSGIVGAVVVALVMTFLGRILSWYANTLLGICLYASATLWCMLYFQYRVRGQSKARGVNPWRLEKDVSRGVLLLFTVLLVISTIAGLGSSYYFFLWSIFTMLQMVMSFWLYKKAASKTDTTRYKWRIGSLIPVTATFCINFYTIAAAMALFFPIMGRCGAETPAEVVVAVLISVMSGFTCVPLLPVAHWGGHFKRVLKVLAVIFGFILLVAIFTSPYTTVRPKRVAIQHTTYYPEAKVNQNLDKTAHHDSHTLLIHVDPVNLDRIFKQARDNGLVDPSFQPLKYKLPHRDLTTVYPLDNFMGGYAIPASRVNLTVPRLNVLKDEYHEHNNVRSLTLEVDYAGAEWSAMKFSAPLIAWSLGDEIPPAPQDHYFIRHIGGYGVTSWKIDLQVHGNTPFEVYVCVSHFDHSEDLKEVLKIFPSWTVPIAWMSASASFKV
eukprot:TRINITY_DN528_c0_g1_i1.p1 TRINITY_DN528_c0_g1~~TRINITY_DN528_c0_g1_i1.p1  ORF type:complete len:897 (-),score=141.06 TRINITY_DN528_c0_g1_i1:204-2894(-)